MDAVTTAENPTVRHLADLIADAIVLDARERDSEDEADHNGPGRVLATVDGREYVITVAANTEQPGVTRKPAPDARLLDAARLVIADCHKLAKRLAEDDTTEAEAGELLSCLSHWHAAVAENAEGDAP